MRMWLVLIAIWWVLPCAAKVERVVGSHSIWPPYFISEELGLGTEIVKAAFAQNRVDFVFQPAPFSRAMRLLDSGEIDLIAALWRTPARDVNYLFSDPYIDNELVFVSQPKLAWQYQSLQSLSGHSLCTIRGFGYQMLLDEIPDLTTMTLLDLSACMFQVSHGRVDGLIGDKVAVNYAIHEDPHYQTLQIHSPNIVTWPVHIGVLKTHPDAKAIITTFNQGLAKIRANGEYQTILARYAGSLQPVHP
ncbi:substrate-binding periplasmic protein [Pseudoalteromonas fenneropenaei]|uniref:Substrate-binding periplasmic protein n=1 Tax=Pseudoalteromonas fenneropenaei TaxID=1737459 RepID=A0ABV7CJQ4_9GAMM